MKMNKRISNQVVWLDLIVKINLVMAATGRLLGESTTRASDKPMKINQDKLSGYQTKRSQAEKGQENAEKKASSSQRQWKCDDKKT